jgi:hypothetical protein
MYYFDGNDFAGIDEHGRKYSIIWLPVAAYDIGTDTWTYYGKKSSTSKYVGWYYSVEWYGVDGTKIASDCIKINLSDETCHNTVEPYYMSNVVKGISFNGTLLGLVDGTVNIATSDEFTIAEDGTLGIGKISASNIVQDEGEVLVLDGGASN